MAYLITATEVNSIAYITAIPEANIKDSIIAQVQEVDVRETLGLDLYNALVGDVVTYTILHNDFVKPYMAYKIKEMILTLDNTEGVISTELSSAAELAAQFYQSLNLYINRTYSVTTKLVSGFIVDSIATLPEVGRIPDTSPEFTASLKTKLDGIEAGAEVNDVADFQSNSSATSIGYLVADYNSLLAKLIASGLMKSS